MVRRGPCNGRCAARRIKRLSGSGKPTERQAADALAAFLTAPRSEGAFFIAFWGLDSYQRKALQEYWGISDDWRLFKRVCRFFAV
jgi:hypothetical protein